MRQVHVADELDAKQIEKLYGPIDLDNEGQPKDTWKRRNLRTLRLDTPLRSPWYPDMSYRRVLVHRRIHEPMGRVLAEINSRWTPEARRAHGLDQFVKAFCFGDGEGPSLFWWGAAWRLSPEVGGEVLEDAKKIFVRHGFKHASTTDRRRVRDFEFW